MKRTVPRLNGVAREVAKGELIGLQLKVESSPCSDYVGLAGEVMDETLHTLQIRTEEGKTLVLPKPACTFSFSIPSGPQVIEGRAIEFRSWDRSKKVR